jgi:hypothetical protein
MVRPPTDFVKWRADPGRPINLKRYQYEPAMLAAALLLS